MCLCICRYSQITLLFSVSCVWSWLLLQGRSLGRLVWLWTRFPSTILPNWRPSVKPGTLGISWVSHWVGGNTHLTQTHTHSAANRVSFFILVWVWDELVFTVNILANNSFCFLPVHYKITMHVLTPVTSVCWFLQIQSMSILEALWVSTSAFLISTPGLCSHQQYWVCPSHSTQVGVKMFIFTTYYMYVQDCTAFLTYSTESWFI